MKRSPNPLGRPVGRSLDRKSLPCTKCGKTKKADKFPVINGTRRGSWCDECMKVHQQEMYEQRKERAKQLARKGLKKAMASKKAK